eukprot:10261368-Alexandrium_andersonii.AAC.1
MSAQTPGAGPARQAHGRPASRAAALTRARNAHVSTDAPLSAQATHHVLSTRVPVLFPAKADRTPPPALRT